MKKAPLLEMGGAGLGGSRRSWRGGATEPSHIAARDEIKGGSEKCALWTGNMRTTDRVAYAAKPTVSEPLRPKVAVARASVRADRPKRPGVNAKA